MQSSQKRALLASIPKGLLALPAQPWALGLPACSLLSPQRHLVYALEGLGHVRLGGHHCSLLRRPGFKPSLLPEAWLTQKQELALVPSQLLPPLRLLSEVCAPQPLLGHTVPVPLHACTDESLRGCSAPEAPRRHQNQSVHPPAPFLASFFFSLSSSFSIFLKTDLFL